MSAIALGLDRAVLELKMYSREKEAVFFSFLFPILLLALFSVIFGSQFDRGNGMTAGGYFLPGMLSAGVLLTSFQTMAMSVTAERDDGTLKRLRATPMPPVAYFFGKVGLVAISSTVQVALLLLVARLAARVPGGEVPALTVTRPSLEDTYLAMIAPHVTPETHDAHDPTEVPA